MLRLFATKAGALAALALAAPASFQQVLGQDVQEPTGPPPPVAGGADRSGGFKAFMDKRGSSHGKSKA